MVFSEIYTLIAGVLVVGTLSIIYLKYYIKNVKIRKKVVYGNKSIKRAYYILKHSGFKIIDINREYKYNIISEDEKISRKVLIDIIASKSGKRYAVFYADDGGANSLNEKILFRLLLSKITHCLILNPEEFSKEEYEIKI